MQDPFYPVDVVQWKCNVCGATEGRSSVNPELCSSCNKRIAEKNAVEKKTHSNWMEEAKALGIEIFERQPGESDAEWRIWDAYRSHYPNKLPTYSELAKELGCSPATVVKAANVWNYRVRMVAWARYTDAAITEQRKEAIKEMNAKQLEMVKSMNDKITSALASLNPEVMKPNEIVNMAKLALEMERKIKTYVEEAVEQPQQDVAAAKMAEVKKEDLGQIVDILAKMGKFDNKTVGVETTTRVIIKGDEDATPGV